MSGSVTQEQTAELTLEDLVRDPNDIDEISMELSRAKSERARLEKAEKLLDAQSQRIMRERLKTDHHAFYDPVVGHKRLAKIVTGEETVVDLETVRARLGQAAVDAIIAPPKVSITRWEHALETGVISVEVAAECTTFRPKAPYIRFYNAD